VLTRVVVVLTAALAAASVASRAPQTTRGFAADLAFLQAHTSILVLGDADGPRVAIAPQYQGRVMTSTTGGADAPSFGWIGREAVASGVRQPHMNVFGGEDRFWLGPEGGQYGLYFKPGDPFDLDHWQTPEPFDWGAWTVAASSPEAATFTRRMDLVNHSGAAFTIDVRRTVRLLGAADAGRQLHVSVPPGAALVAFESENTITNAGRDAWDPARGLVSIWILGQFAPSPSTTIAIPFVAGPETSLGPTVNDAYFGKVPADRLRIADGVIRFRGDGQYRSKIGLSPQRTTGVAGSYDAAAHVLTIVQFDTPAGARDYVNSMWETQKAPYRGDALNSYNDGPLGPGQPGLGPFYELESSSPALKLKPGERHTHTHRTFHFQGPEASLDPLARAVLHVSLADLAATFASGPRHNAPAQRSQSSRRSPH
jgi:hypothetical protein